MPEEFAIPEQYAEAPWAEGITSQEQLFEKLNTLHSSSQFKIPDEYKEKGWASKVKSNDDLFKQIDTLDSLKGKKEVRPTIDHANATPEEIADFYKGRAPEDANSYSFGKEGDDEGVITGMKTAFQKAHLDDYQAGILSEAWREFAEDSKAKAYDPEEYNALLKESFGDDFKKVAGAASNELVEHMTDEEKKFFNEGFPNKYADFVLKIVNRMMTKYGVQEQLPPGGGGGGEGGLNSIEKIEAEQTKVRQQIRDLSRGYHTAEQKQTLLNKLNDLAKQKMTLQSAKK